MKLTDWARRWGIPAQAMIELHQLSVHTQSIGIDDITNSEAAVSHSYRVQASELGGRLWRNNVGAGRLENGSFVRWGLCNDTVQLNKEIKSADLIGIKPVTIEQSHVGLVIGQFWSREVKVPGWTYRGTPAEQAQLKWVNLINTLGGDASMSSERFLR
jgi:hypothetical protein